MPSADPQRAIRWPLAAAAAGALALSAWLVTRSTAPLLVPSPELAGGMGTAAATDDAAQPAEGGASGGTAAGGTAEPPAEILRTTPPREAELAQGLRGIVIDEGGAPLPGVPVHLVESAANDPLLLPLAQRQQHFLSPVASTRTDADGAFALGLEVLQDRIYEVFVASPRHATARRTNLRLLPDTWHDLGTITLQAGIVVRGRVTVAGQPDMPVPNAVVSLESGGAFADAALRALPSGQGTLVATVDHGGYYQLDRAPRHGVVQLVAQAPGFARGVQRAIDLSADGPIVVDFSLPPGSSLSGSVRSETGGVVAGARVEAWSTDRTDDPLVAITDEQGAFVLHGLRSPEFTLRVTAAGYTMQELASPSLEAPVDVRLRALGSLRIVVRTEAGEVARRYRLAVHRFFPQDPGHASTQPIASGLPPGVMGPLPEVREQVVRLGPTEQQVTVPGVPAGLLVCEVQADGYARSWSTPFSTENLGSGETLEVDMVLTRGAELRARVVDAAGRPLAGARVQTQPDGMAPDNALFRMLQASVPTRSSDCSAITDRDGWFSLPRLALATYQLEVTHPAACRTFVRGIDLSTAGVRALEPIVLPGGALVHGIATANGRLAGQIKVVLATPAATPPEHSLRLETITDAEGRFSFDRRVPPGEYELRGAIVGDLDADADAFRLLLQLQRSATPITVPPGADELRRDLDLPPAN